MDEPSVLVIDADRTNLAMVERVLHDGRMRVDSAGSAGEGTALARQRRPDVIILDLALPDADGVALCRQWGEDPELGEIPVLLVSDERTEGAHPTAGVRPGALGYLARPFSDAELIAQVRLLHQLRRTHGELQRRNAELEASNRELQQYAYVASHDLKEPLRTIAGYCQLLADRYRGRLDSQADEFIDQALSGVARMRQFIDDLLAYSRAGVAGSSAETVRLDEVIRRALGNLHQAIEETGAAFQLDPLPAVQAEPRMMLQLFQNLIANAIRFHDQTPPQVRITGQSTPQGCRVSVSDNGIGIDPCHFDRIFGVFQRLHGPDEYPGTGIGLAICKKIVECHGGRLWVESAPGHGSTFHVELPA